MEKEGNVKYTPKNKKRRARNVKGVFPDFQEDGEEQPCELWLEIPFTTLCAKMWQAPEL
jgi:hypothetical protein